MADFDFAVEDFIPLNSDLKLIFHLKKELIPIPNASHFFLFLKKKKGMMKIFSDKIAQTEMLEFKSLNLLINVII